MAGRIWGGDRPALKNGTPALARFPEQKCLKTSAKWRSTLFLHESFEAQRINTLPYTAPSTAPSRRSFAPSQRLK
jgi:hypothetical protein